MPTSNKELIRIYSSRIAAHYNLKLSLSDARKAGDRYYMRLDYNVHYGGYRLEIVETEPGTTFGAFNNNGMERRYKAEAFAAYLKGVWDVISYPDILHGLKR